MDSPMTSSGGISPEAIETVKLEARKEGIFAGLTSGLASGENLCQSSYELSGVLSGVLFTQAFRDTAMAKLRAEEARLRSQPKIGSEMQTENPSDPSV
ncbi:hypothetical protein JR316_0001447 [Psilocybe cubensis]|uniref:Uncharacterized protein n=1 Tax=Psilocybe cubensis TaxID=181762 RepID=A0ACB8HI31_PSICU|nr:hypothetical protein JR316_0001447 [Psilocybe cubensis]KAH9487372.1 hypothetical protein JR316_0001447 [Psilocybe cubensis]